MSEQRVDIKLNSVNFSKEEFDWINSRETSMPIGQRSMAGVLRKLVRQAIAEEDESFQEEQRSLRRGSEDTLEMEA